MAGRGGRRAARCSGRAVRVRVCVQGACVRKRAEARAACARRQAGRQEKAGGRSRRLQAVCRVKNKQAASAAVSQESRSITIVIHKE